MRTTSVPSRTRVPRSWSRMPRPMRCTGPALLCLLAACSGGGSGPAPLQTAPAGVRAAGTRTSGSGEVLCAELLVTSGFPAKSPLHPEFALADSLLAQRIGRMALDHLTSTGLGAGTGPELAGSQRIRRLALLPSAKPELNQNGTNLDDVLQAERTRIVAEAGTFPLEGTWQAFLPWRHASTLLSGPLGSSAAVQPGTWRTQPDSAPHSIALADAGGAMAARALAVSHLLLTGRGTLAGATADEGRLGLELLHQLLAAEETLVGNLFTDGNGLGALEDPANYDPANGRRWLPAEVMVDQRLQGLSAEFGQGGERGGVHRRHFGRACRVHGRPFDVRTRNVRASVRRLLPHDRLERRA